MQTVFESIVQKRKGRSTDKVSLGSGAVVSLIRQLEKTTVLFLSH